MQPKAKPDDMCPICFCEEIGKAPCLELECGHVMHYECVLKRLSGKWSGLDISFTFASCPICKQKIDHPLLTEQLEDVQELNKNLEDKSYNTLIKEELLEHKSIVDEESEFYQNPAGFARKHYAFYLCGTCRLPYFGGARRCMDGMGDVEAKNLSCASCSGIGKTKCAIHGTEYMQWKCKFCCSLSSYFCWGNTHFCELCHTRQENHDYMTKKSKSELPQCKSAETCPLGIKHPPNGEEYSLGCALCRGSETIVMMQDAPPDEAVGNGEAE